MTVLFNRRDKKTGESYVTGPDSVTYGGGTPTSGGSETPDVMKKNGQTYIGSPYNTDATRYIYSKLREANLEPGSYAGSILDDENTQREYFSTQFLNQLNIPGGIFRGMEDYNIYSPQTGNAQQPGLQPRVDEENTKAETEDTSTGGDTMVDYKAPSLGILDTKAGRYLQRVAKQGLIDGQRGMLQRQIRTQQAASGLLWGGAGAKQEAFMVGAAEQWQKLGAAQSLAQLSEAQSQLPTQLAQLTAQTQQSAVRAGLPQLNIPGNLFGQLYGGSMSGLSNIFGLGGI